MTTQELESLIAADKRGEVEERRLLTDPWASKEPGAPWFFNNFLYRLKPHEPRRMWVNEYMGGLDINCFVTPEAAHAAATRWPGWLRVVEFVEVNKP